MVRRWFYSVAVTILVILLATALTAPAALWVLAIVGPMIAVGVHDALQRTHTVRRNFPLIGRVDAHGA